MNLVFFAGKPVPKAFQHRTSSFPVGPQSCDKKEKNWSRTASVASARAAKSRISLVESCSAARSSQRPWEFGRQLHCSTVWLLTKKQMVWEGRKVLWVRHFSRLPQGLDQIRCGKTPWRFDSPRMTCETDFVSGNHHGLIGLCTGLKH
jgi:hypothetical protein